MYVSESSAVLHDLNPGEFTEIHYLRPVMTPKFIEQILISVL
jgi:hypothetical protein